MAWFWEYFRNFLSAFEVTFKVVNSQSVKKINLPSGHTVDESESIFLSSTIIGCVCEWERERKGETIWIFFRSLKFDEMWWEICEQCRGGGIAAAAFHRWSRIHFLCSMINCGSNSFKLGTDFTTATLCSTLTYPCSSLAEGYEGCIDPSGKRFCLWQIKDFLQHTHGIIPYLHAWLFGQSSCSSPSTKELHDFS